MKWQCVGLFATPVIKMQIDESERIKSYFYERIHGQAHEPGIKSESQFLTHWYSHTNVFDFHPELDWVRRKIEEAATFAYCELLNYKKSGPLRITNAWFNLCRVGGTQEQHNHANCRMSGTLYLNTDAQSNIRLMHPLNSIGSMHAELLDLPTPEVNPYGLKFHLPHVDIQVQQGDCLFWPSQTLHGYAENRTPERLSLSFNLMPHRLNTVYQIA